MNGWVLATAALVSLSPGCEGKPTTPSTPAPSSAVPAPYADVLPTLQRAIEERYAYRDRLGLDWKQLFASATPTLSRATSRDQLVKGLAQLLAHAKDPHLDLIVDGTIVRTDPTPITLNVSLPQLQKRVSGLRPAGRCLTVGKVDEMAYALVNGLENGRCDSLPADWEAAYPALRDAGPGLILDLRGNAGGNEAFAQRIAGTFVDRPVAYAKSETRDAAAPGGFRPPVVRTLQPVTGLPRYESPVVVLAGPYNMSSAEAFLLMMRAAGAPIIGSTSRGSSGNPKEVELGHGIKVRIPSWRALRLDGTLLEGTGVAPDVDVPVKPEDLVGDDKVINAALVELRRRLAR